MKLNPKLRSELYDFVYNEGDSEDVRILLYEEFMHDMPYGTAKARDGDPDQWIADHMHLVEDRFCEELEDEACRREAKGILQAEFTYQELEEAKIRGEK